MFSVKIRKTIQTPVKPFFSYIKWDFSGCSLHCTCKSDDQTDFWWIMVNHITHQYSCMNAKHPCYSILASISLWEIIIGNLEKKKKKKKAIIIVIIVLLGKYLLQPPSGLKCIGICPESQYPKGFDSFDYKRDTK